MGSKGAGGMYGLVIPQYVVRYYQYTLTDFTLVTVLW